MNVFRLTAMEKVDTQTHTHTREIKLFANLLSLNNNNSFSVELPVILHLKSHTEKFVDTTIARR